MKVKILTDFQICISVPLIHTIPKAWGYRIPIKEKKYGKTNNIRKFS